MLNRIVVAVILCGAGASMVSPRTDDGACHVSVPADWKSSPILHMAEAPGPGTFRALVKTINAEHYARQ